SGCVFPCGPVGACRAPRRSRKSTRPRAPDQPAVTTPLASPVAVPSVADFGIAWSFLRAVQTCWALAFSTITRLGFDGSYRTGIVIMCILLELMLLRPLAKPMRELTEPRSESAATAL